MIFGSSGARVLWPAVLPFFGRGLPRIRRRRVGGRAVGGTASSRL